MQILTHTVMCVYVYFIMIMDGRSAAAAAAYSQQLLLCVGVCGFCSAVVAAAAPFSVQAFSPYRTDAVLI